MFSFYKSERRQFIEENNSLDCSVSPKSDGSPQNENSPSFHSSFTHPHAILKLLEENQPSKSTPLTSKYLLLCPTKKVQVLVQVWHISRVS